MSVTYRAILLTQCKSTIVFDWLLDDDGEFLRSRISQSSGRRNCGFACWTQLGLSTGTCCNLEIGVEIGPTLRD